MMELAIFESLFVPEPNSGCWIWMGTGDGKGYGRFGSVGAHRASYELYCGEQEGTDA